MVEYDKFLKIWNEKDPTDGFQIKARLGQENCVTVFVEAERDAVHIAQMVCHHGNMFSHATYWNGLLLSLYCHRKGAEGKIQIIETQSLCYLIEASASHFGNAFEIRVVK